MDFLMWFGVILMTLGMLGYLFEIVAFDPLYMFMGGCIWNGILLAAKNTINKG